MGETHNDAQAALWHDSIYDAVGADVQSCGGFKRVAPKIFRGLDETTAATRLRNSLNPDQPHVLGVEELVALLCIARAAGAHATMTYLARELGYALTPIEPATERDELDRRIADGIESLNKLLGHRERKFGPLAVAK